MTTPDERPDLPTPDAAPATTVVPETPATTGPAASTAGPAASISGAAGPGPGPTADTWRRLDQRAEAFGHEIEDAATRLSTNPGVRAAGDAAARLWGVVLLVAGLWLLARITLRIAVPDVSWDLLGPALVILLGLLVIARAGRRA